MENRTNLQKRLFSLQDKTYQEFQCKLIPGIEKETIIGVRTPELRKIAKEMQKNGEWKTFLTETPHLYFEENNLHAYLLSEMKDVEEVMRGIEDFLPFINNWATCDSLSPRILKDHSNDIYEKAYKWIQDEKIYTVRFGVGIFMKYFLEDNFRPEIVESIIRITSEEYYINMMCAWYMATALAKQYEAVWPYFKKIPEKNSMLSEKEKGQMNATVYRMAVQKALESNRIKEEVKEQLKRLRQKAKSARSNA